MNKIFSIKNDNNHKCLCILGIKFKWLNQNKYLETCLNNIANNIKIQNDETLNELSSDFQNIITSATNNIQNVLFKNINSINEKQNLLSEKLSTTKENLANKLQKLQGQMSLIKDELCNIKNSNQLDFVYKNIDNPQYEFLYNDLYKMFTAGEYYSMNNIYTKRINKYTIDKNINQLKGKYANKIYLLTDLAEQIDICDVIDIKSIDILKDKENAIFVLAYNQDYLGLKAIAELRKYNLKYFALEQYGTPQARYYHINEAAYHTLIEEANNHPLLHYCPGDFENIFQAIEATKQLAGDYVEIGTFQGASARAVLNYLNRVHINKKCYFIDTYEGFTYEEAQHTEDMLWTNSHTDTSILGVQTYLSGYSNFELIKSNIIQNELPRNIKNICVVNIDVDMYEAVKAALYKVKDRVVKNGIIIAEDYGHTPALIGAQKAVDEFLHENPDDFIPLYFSSGQMFLIKK